MDTIGEGEEGMNLKSNIEKYTLAYVKYILSRNLLYNAGSAKLVPYDSLEGCDHMGDGKEI